MTTSETATTDGGQAEVTYENLYESMRQRVPALQLDLDAWTVRMMKWHFSEATGAPFWLNQRDKLGFDPLSDIKDYASLSKFGFFDKETLRQANVRDLLPRGLAGHPYRVLETGGTTGAPCRIVNVTRMDIEVKMYSATLEARGVAGGDVVGMVPSGPHAYGHFVARLVDSWCSAAHFIDLDPRWIKELLRHGQATDGYVKHVIAQTEILLQSQRPSILFTTPKLLSAMVEELTQPLAEYGVRAVCTGGTSCSREEVRYIQEEYLEGIHWVDTYGNTLMGHALQANPMTPTDVRSYHLPPPLGVIRVVDPKEPTREVAVGQRGRVCITTLLEDLFIPNLLERDSAIRVGPHPWYPWDGVSDVAPFTENEDDLLTEGVY